jgi:hypothetical protein
MRPRLAWPDYGVTRTFSTLAGVHRLVAGRRVVEADGVVEDLAGVDAALEHFGQGLLDVGADRGGAAGKGRVLAEQGPEADRRVLVLRDADPGDDPAGADDAVGRFQ